MSHHSRDTQGGWGNQEWLEAPQIAKVVCALVQQGQTSWPPPEGFLPQTPATASPHLNTHPHCYHNILLPALDLSFTAANGPYISTLVNRTLTLVLKEHGFPNGKIQSYSKSGRITRRV